jgi:predicted transcriptional regulator
MKDIITIKPAELKTLIVECRKAKNVSMTELAKMLKTSKQNIYSMETGRHALGLKRVEKVVIALGGKLEIVVTFK